MHIYSLISVNFKKFTKKSTLLLKILIFASETNNKFLS